MPPLTEGEFQRLVKRARRTNQKRDGYEREAGFASPSRCPPGLELRTVQSALDAGMRCVDWDCVAEGYAMLEDFLDRYHPIPVRSGGQS